ncbi:MAG: hypothetical protein ACRDL8_01130, partial [Solirubrobacteraceae bacterium]
MSGEVEAGEIALTLDDVAAIGNRYTGTRGESICRDYLVERFRRAGLSSVSLERFDCLGYEPIDAGCSILGPE